MEVTRGGCGYGGQPTERPEDGRPMITIEAAEKVVRGRFREREAMAQVQVVPNSGAVAVGPANGVAGANPPPPPQAAGAQAVAAAATGGQFGPTSLYVGDLDPTVMDLQLYDLFSQAGPVVSVRVCCDVSTRCSLGYAYVNCSSPIDASRAMEVLNFTLVNNKPIRVMYSL